MEKYRVEMLDYSLIELKPKVVSGENLTREQAIQIKEAIRESYKDKPCMPTFYIARVE